MIDPTLEWYYSLAKNSVDSFDTFCGRFLVKFTDCKPVASTSTSLHNVVQGEAESLREFMAQFSWTTLNIPNLHPVVSMHALLMGLRPGKFLDILYVKPPEDMNQLRARAAKYIGIEENADT